MYAPHFLHCGIFILVAMMNPHLLHSTSCRLVFSRYFFGNPGFTILMSLQQYLMYKTCLNINIEDKTCKIHETNGNDEKYRKI